MPDTRLLRSDVDIDETDPLADIMRSRCTRLLYSSLRRTASVYSALSLARFFQCLNTSFMIMLRALNADIFWLASDLDQTRLLVDATLPFGFSVIELSDFAGLLVWLGKGNRLTDGDDKRNGLNISTSVEIVCIEGNPFRDLFDLSEGRCTRGVLGAVGGSERGSGLGAGGGTLGLAAGEGIERSVKIL